LAGGGGGRGGAQTGGWILGMFDELVRELRLAWSCGLKFAELKADMSDSVSTL